MAVTIRHYIPKLYSPLPVREKLIGQSLTNFSTKLSLYIVEYSICSVSTFREIMASSVTTALSRPPPEIVRGQSFDVGPRYYGLNYIGEGAYGMVWYVWLAHL